MCHFCDNNVPVKVKVQIPLVDNKGIPNGKVLTMSKTAYNKILQQINGVKNEKLEK